MHQVCNLNFQWMAVQNLNIFFDYGRHQISTKLQLHPSYQCMQSVIYKCTVGVEWKVLWKARIIAYKDYKDDNLKSLLDVSSQNHPAISMRKAADLGFRSQSTCISELTATFAQTHERTQNVNVIPPTRHCWTRGHMSMPNPTCWGQLPRTELNIAIHQALDDRQDHWTDWGKTSNDLWGSCTTLISGRRPNSDNFGDTQDAPRETNLKIAVKLQQKFDHVSGTKVCKQL
jgi:hypothetical protein